MVCSVSLFIACLGKLGSQSLWISEGTMETLLLFVGDFSGQPASSKFKRRLFQQLLHGDTLQKSRSFLSSPWLSLSLLLIP